MAAAYKAYDIDRCVILVSRFGHYSLQKAGGILGIGNKNVVAIDVDVRHHIDIKQLRDTMKRLCGDGRTKILSIIGIAGATETGTIDPLAALSQLCAEHGIHFHVDAAWGGPTLMSDTYRHLLNGIEQADSITIDGHKQFYMPMSCGMVYFKDPYALDAIAYHARYINRPGSVDLGIKSLSGSREANSLILDSALKIMGTNGYALLIEYGIRTAREFADEISRRADFELTSAPELNILTYRFFPAKLKQSLAGLDEAGKKRLYDNLNEINRSIQRYQRESGKSFVSRTSLKGTREWPEERVVLRAVIMNPLTDIRILREILDEQEEIYRQMEAET
jgi:glutamate decarboxylase